MLDSWSEIYNIYLNIYMLPWKKRQKSYIHMLFRSIYIDLKYTYSVLKSDG